MICASSLLFFSGCVNDGIHGPGAGSFSTVVLDAGHGDYDWGAKAVSGQHEKHLALDVVLRMKPLLQQAGYRVILTRERDVFVPLGSRVAVSNRLRNAIFVSVHFNMTERRAVKGIETYFYSIRSKRLAANIQKEVLCAYPTLNRRVRYGRFHVLRNNLRPSVLLELGFVSNPEDNAYIQDPGYRQRLAELIVRGIIAERRGRSPH